ncbi:MAG: hypothetical protein IJH39_01685 [Clostridia bacterium]|nr:hypothetical protein [Clostridia bacterium]
MNNNLDENTMNKIKNMVDKGNISDAISQISPDMIQNFSKMLSNNSKSNQKQNTYSNDKGQNSNSNFDFSNLDMNTIMKMKSIIEQMNNSNDARSNLLQSLKPYMRESKKEKIDQYANLLKMANVAELMKNDKNGGFK